MICQSQLVVAHTWGGDPTFWCVNEFAVSTSKKGH